jgi:methyl-accepting chemotaxis protein
MLARWSIPRLLTLIGVIGVMLTLGAVALSARATYDEALDSKKKTLKELVDAAVTIVGGYQRLAQDGAMTLPEAQKAALTTLGAARFDHGNYYFVYASDGTVLQHVKKAMIGQNRYHDHDAHGTHFTSIMIRTALSGHSIYLRYYFPRPNTTTPEPKMSYSEGIPAWGWMIGTGVYIDDLNGYVIRQITGFAAIFLPLFCAFLILIFFLRRSVSRLLEGVTIAMEQIGGGALETTVRGLDRRDEIGRMARRVTQFRDAAAEKRAFEQRAETERAAIEAERRAREAEREAATRDQAFVVESVAAGLAKLSAGDLRFRLTTPFGAEYDMLRSDFNAAMEKLGQVMTSIAGNAQAVQSAAGEITQASDDLSHRTEQQAATLEQTAAALDQITTTVRRTAEGARDARSLVSTTRADAEESSAVVRETVAAMNGIEESSQKIANILGVIDEIAFQTNLLALNAGVEAARAGEAGRGFAVVATEVRALAQRSADAAREIKALIAASGKQVVTGVKLVGETGAALTRIADQVARLNQLVSDIAASAQEQATALSEVNVAVNQMDQVTQQNAAMVEQSTAASHGMAMEVHDLSMLIGQFEIGLTGGPAATARASAAA